MRSDEIMTDTEQTEQAATLVIAALDSPTMEEDSPDAGDDSDSANGARVGAMRKVRQNFTTTQLAILECVFNSTPLPRKAIRAQLAEQLGLPQRSVQVWFQNRRQKWKHAYRHNLISAVSQQQARRAAESASAEGEPVGADSPEETPSSTTADTTPIFVPVAGTPPPALSLTPPELWQKQWQAHVQTQLELHAARPASGAGASPVPPKRAPTAARGVGGGTMPAAAAPPLALSTPDAHGARHERVAPAWPGATGAASALDRLTRESSAACEGLLMLSSCAQIDGAVARGLLQQTNS